MSRNLPDGTEQRKDQEQEEADMDGPHHLARQADQIGGGDDLEHREGDGDPEQDPPLQCRRESFRKRIFEREFGVLAIE
jgi:hypothetical protein